MGNKTIDYSQVFNIVKVFAIFSVILAHSKIQDGTTYAAIAERLGSIGVVVFFFISGFFFNVRKYGVLAFFKKKIKSIIIPWVVLGSLIFFISSQPKIFYCWFNWIIGNGSYLYYLTVLMICYILFAISQNKIILYSSIIMNITSIVLTSFFLNDFPFSEINHYLNPLNWIGIFALGMLMKYKTKMFFIFTKNYRLVIILSFFYILYISIKLDKSFGYFSKFSLLVEVSGIVALFALATFSIFNFKSLELASKYTFSIYLIHFLTFPIKKILIINEFTQFINPIIYFLIAILLLKTGEFIANKLNKKKLYHTIMGFR